MRRKQSLLLFLILLCLSAQCYAQNWTGILDPSRAIDWSNSGIPGGIPKRTTVCATISASTYGNGSSDATAGIQNALKACPANQVVSLSSGTFLISSSISIPSNVTLRGSGAQSTILNLRGSGKAAIYLGSGDITSTAVSITGGATAKSTSITVSSATGITVGSYLHITEVNDPNYVTSTGNEGACTWCDGYWSGTRARGQIVEVTSVSGTTIGISPALYSAYPNTPQAVPFTASVKYAGVENLQVYANNTGYTTNFLMSRSAYSWIKGVESNYADGDHVEANWSYRGEIRDSYFSNAYSHSSGNTDGDVFLAFKTSGFLVENNILERLHASIMLARGPAGNVIAYNYMFGNFDSGSPDVLIANIDEHGAHPQFNLFEGNVGAQFYPDSIWGSSSHETAFRNSMSAITFICNPLSGRSATNCSTGHWATQANRAFQIASLQRYMNIVGNIAGSPDAASQMSQVSTVVSPQSRAYDGVAYSFTFGYAGLGDSTGVCSSPSSSCPMYATAFLHGNYDNATGGVSWSSTNSNHTLPPSFYRSSKPSWWGSTPWPSIGPDVAGGAGAGGHSYDIPAQACYKNTSKDANGMLMFNSDTCYGPTVTAPAPPTNLTVVVK